MKINENYAVTENDVKYKEGYEPVASIKILSGDYKDVEFHFGEVNITEDEANGNCFLSFTYDIISEHTIENVQDFEVTLESIMNDLLIESLNMAEEKYKNELRKENTETSDSR
jgi:hypothetical protein